MYVITRHQQIGLVSLSLKLKGTLNPSSSILFWLSISNLHQRGGNRAFLNMRSNCYIHNITCQEILARSRRSTNHPTPVKKKKKRKEARTICIYQISDNFTSQQVSTMRKGPSGDLPQNEQSTVTPKEPHIRFNIIIPKHKRATRLEHEPRLLLQPN